MAAYQERSSIYCVVRSTVLLRSPSWLSVVLSTQEPNKHNKIFWIFIFLLMLLLCCWFRHRNQTGIAKSFEYSLIQLLYFWFGKTSQTSLYHLRIDEWYILEWMTTTKCFFRKMQIWFGLMVVAVFAAGEGELCNNGWDEIHDIFCVLLFPPSPHRHLDYWDH